MLTVTEAHSQGPESRYPTAEVLQLPPQLRGHVTTRMIFGLNADVAYVRQLRGSAKDVGSEKFYFPMTQAECDEMRERWDFSDAAEETVIPYVRTLPTFAGIHYDHLRDGDLIISLTDVNPEIRNKISSLVPKGRDTRIKLVDYREDELLEAAKQVLDVWKEASGPMIYVIAIDQPTNSLVIEVDPAEIERAQKVISQISFIITVPMFVTVGEQPVDAA